VSGRELLLILDEGSAPDLLRHLDSGLTITHRVSPRIVVLKGGDDALAEIAGRQGVNLALERGANQGSFEGLSEGERLFVAGWISSPPSRDRPGDGLTWDAPGYTPPG